MKKSTAPTKTAARSRKPSSIKKPVSKAPTRRKATASKKGTKPKTVRPHHVGGVVLAIAAIVISSIWLSTRLPQLAGAASCSVDANLVNSCRPWLGATSSNYPGVGAHLTDLRAHILDHENRIGRQLDMVHSYRTPSHNNLSETDKFFATRAGTILFTTWKPTNTWSEAAGGNATVNAAIDSMADSIKSVAPNKIMFSVYHEPEDNVSGGASGCSAANYKGTDGTTTEYRNMWRNVYNRMNARGVSNVVWVMNYMGFENHNCMVDDLWPGNDIVDWVMWDPYSEAATWNQMIDPFYSFLTSNSNATNNYASKAWGLAEWGAWKATTQQNTYSLYDGGRAALAANTYPKLKAYVVFDYGEVTRVAYDAAGNYDATEMAKYREFARSPYFTNAQYETPDPAPDPDPTPDPTPNPTPADTTAPNVTLSGPVNGAVIKGAVTVTGSASDNVGVTNVALFVDGKWVANDGSSPYSFKLDTTRYGDGNHSIKLRAWDAAENTKESATITIKIANSVIGGNPGSPVIKPPASNPDKPVVLTPDVIKDLPSSTPIPISGTLEIKPTMQSGKVIVKIDGKVEPSGKVDSTKLTDGEHTVEVTENGKTKTFTVTVDNPLPLQLLNELRAHPVPYAVGSTVSVLLGSGAFYFRKRLF